jgi:VIT1/CCC1 family predicted Fe2+/Mn2+ transporter
MHDLARISFHKEGHFESSESVRDVVIGLSDGLTVPFALAAGLSGAVSNAHIIVLAGLAEIAAGSIAMGLGGYLAARGDAEHYASELAREQEEVITRYLPSTPSPASPQRPSSPPSSRTTPPTSTS